MGVVQSTIATGRPCGCPAGKMNHPPQFGSTGSAVTDFKPGLEGVIAFETEIAEPDRDGGALRYRGVDIEDLIGQVSFGNVWGLLVDGKFGPGLPPAEPFPVPVHSGDIRVDVQSAVAMLAPYWGLSQLFDITDEQARKDLARVSVTALSFVAQAARGLGLPAVPQKDIDKAETIVERFMRRWRGEPDPRHVKAVDAYFIAACEHGLNASTFTARIVASTGADAAACISSGIGALSGPLHGGAPTRVLHMLEAVERAGDADSYVKDVLDRGERLMGFGHRVYRAEDPRARVLRRIAKDLSAPRYEVAAALEIAALAELRERKPDHELWTNVEFWAAVVLDFAEVPAHMFTSMFTCARVAGWSAHILEQKRLGRILRPGLHYVGAEPRKPQEVEGWNQLAHNV
jgi:citrate synthase